MSTHIRILQCLTCKSMEELPDYAGPPEDDVILQHLLVPHGGETETPHHGAMHRVDAKHWENRRIRQQIVTQMWASTKGFVPEYYHTRNTLLEEANKCFAKHRRSIPCIDYQDRGKRLGNPAARERKALSKDTRRDFTGGGPKVFLCNFCPVQSIVDQKKRDLGAPAL